MSVTSAARDVRDESAADVVAEAEALPRDRHDLGAFLSRSHGFLPIEPPLTSLPPGHRAWDEAAAMLPRLNATQRFREVLGELPVLSAAPDALDDLYVWRAALLLGYLAHAYVNVATDKAPLPVAIAAPWLEANRRLGRAHPGLSMTDYCCYNWRLLDATGPRLVENMGLLVAWVNNEAERVFMTAATEMHARSAPLVDAAANLHGAVVCRDAGAAKVELLRLLDYIKDITYKSLLKIDPNPYSRTYCDPLVWTRAWVAYTPAINEHERGLGGSGTPIIQLLDAIFERNVYASTVAQESMRLRGWLPSYPARFIECFRRISLSRFVAETGDSELAGIYDSLLDAYAGRRSFLSVHRLKVYGFMELGFKAGRTETNSGFSGAEENRAWDELDDTLEATRRERHVGRAPRCPMATRAAVARVADSGSSPVSKVVLDIADRDIHYKPDDRLNGFLYHGE